MYDVPQVMHCVGGSVGPRLGSYRPLERGVDGMGEERGGRVSDGVRVAVTSCWQGGNGYKDINIERLVTVTFSHYHYNCSGKVILHCSLPG